MVDYNIRNLLVSIYEWVVLGGLEFIFAENHVEDTGVFPGGLE